MMQTRLCNERDIKQNSIVRDPNDESALVHALATVNDACPFLDDDLRLHFQETPFRWWNAARLHLAPMLLVRGHHEKHGFGITLVSLEPLVLTQQQCFVREFRRAVIATFSALADE